MDLDDTQTRLDKHFRDLATQRAGQGHPIYALEHPFDAAEGVALAKALDLDLAQRWRPCEAHWLVWAAGAAEVGYRYDGEHYWPLFRQTFPNWRDGNTERDLIRSWFERFHDEFAAHAPKGRWARAYPIIAWPISHSVLPRFLQRLFAQHLYECRFAIARSGALDVEGIGELLRDHYSGSTGRFNDLLQQTELTGRLVLALHTEGQGDAVSPIAAPTWARLVADLGKHGDAGRHLRETRTALRQSSFSVYAPGGGARSSGARAGDIQRAPPSIKLAAYETDESLWRLAIAIPDLATRLRSAGVTRRELDRMRVRIRGGDGAWMHGQTLLSYAGDVNEDLHHPWPEDGQLFEFDTPVAAATAPIADALVLPDKAPFLLRVHEDGVARQVLGRHVRARQSYLVVARAPLADATVSALALREQKSRTAGVHLYRLSPPSMAKQPFIQALSALRLGYAFGARLLPVGLTPRWDAATESIVYLTNESVTLRIESDVAVSEFVITLDGDAYRAKSGEKADLFVDLGPLALGTHNVQVTAVNAAVGKNLASDDLAITVRAPTPWPSAVADKAGVRLTIEPRGATLDDALDERARVGVIAPPGRSVRLEARLFGFHGFQTERCDLGACKTPVAPAAMLSALRKLRGDTLAERVAGAPRIDIAARLEEFGTATIQFEHPVEPLRWSLAGSPAARKAVLSNDTGGVVTVSSFSVARPDVEHTVPIEQALSGVAIEAPGVLVVAKSDTCNVSALIGVLGESQGFASLITQVDLNNDRLGVGACLNHYKRWLGARLLGALAGNRRLAVLGAFERRIERILCGAEWQRLADDVRGGERALADLSVARPPTGFDTAMRSTDWRGRKDAIAEFSRVADRYQVCSDAGLCAVAFTLAFDPGSLRKTDLPRETAFQDLRSLPSLTRGAYLAHIAANARARQDAGL